MNPALIKISAALGILLVLVVAALLISRVSSRPAPGEGLRQEPGLHAEIADGQKIVLQGLGMN
ncbi:MAG: hypothetical protein HYX95_00945 [Chloroflexi bacterium]|nr:hypothetical protein [Chloroflexota bacterium]